MTLLRSGGLAFVAFLLSSMLSFACAADTIDNEICTDTFSSLNDNPELKAFDDQEGGREKRLEFRLSGTEPCNENSCRLDILREAPKPTGTNDPALLAMGDRLIASVNLSHRGPSYCVTDLGRVAVERRSPWDDDPGHQQLRKSCPESYLHNSLAIKFKGGSEEPYLKRWIEIEYIYWPRGSDVDLDWCTTPSFVDGVFRRQAWTVPLADGAVVIIAETDTPKAQRGPRSPNLLTSGDQQFYESPYLVTVFGARERRTW